jgi:MFS family permease
MPDGAPPPPRLWDPRWRLLLVGVVCLVTVVALEAMAITTVMPLVERDLGDLWLYGWAFSAFYLGGLVGIVLGGRAADRMAPVLPLVAGLVVFGAGLVAGGAAPTMAVLVLGRLLQGVGAGAVPTGVMPKLRESGRQRRKTPNARSSPPPAVQDGSGHSSSAAPYTVTST